MEIIDTVHRTTIGLERRNEEAKNENDEASDYRCLLRLADLLVPSSRRKRGLREVDRGWATSAVINLNQQMPSRVYTD